MSNPYEAPETSADGDVGKAIGPSVRGLQFMTAAMVLAPLVIWGMLLFLNSADMSGSADLLGYIGLGFAALVVVVDLVLPPIIERASLNKLNTTSFQNASFSDRCQKTLNALRTPHMVRCATLEGGSVVNAMMYHLLEHWIGNVVAGGVLLALIVIRFPTQTSMTFRVEDRLRQLQS